MPTALELTKKGWKRYIEAASRRTELPRREHEGTETRGELLYKVRKAAELLKIRFGARRVLLFGSLAHEAWFMPDSDVDLAVEGLNARDYWQAWRMVEEVIKDRPVDLIEIEGASESLKRAIERYGVEL